MQVYRVFVVYERKYVWIIIPSMLYLADIGKVPSLYAWVWTTNAVATALSVWSEWTITAVSSEMVSLKRAQQEIEFFYTITLALNLLCTGKDELWTG